MNLFDQLVAQALRGQTELVPLQGVVEKELLHHDILREMSAAGLLEQLTFMGGTCLRTCYGSLRLSEDLDFTGGRDFTREQLRDLGATLVEKFSQKYGLLVEVSEPTREAGNVPTWKLRIDRWPEQKGLPAQRINIDICAVPSHDRRPLMLRNYYGIDMGTAGLIIQAQSREEILADKLVALALRPNRVKNRDLWDIGWLKQQGVVMPVALLSAKLADHRRTHQEFLALLQERRRQLRDEPGMREQFVQEMRRFLPGGMVAQTVAKQDYWSYLSNLIDDECAQAAAFLAGVML